MRFLILLLLLLSASSYGDTHQRRQKGEGFNLWLPLSSGTSDERGNDGSFIRATASVCALVEATTTEDLASGEACYPTYGALRFSPVVTNRSRNSEAINLWVASSTTVDADYAAAPDTSVTAERVRMNANGDYIRGGTSGNLCTANADIAMSVWVKSLAGSCSIYIGNAYGAGFPGIIELVTVPVVWTRVWTQKVAHTDGNCHIIIYRYNASATCTDFLVWGGQIEETDHAAPAQYCPTGAASATCDAETMTLSPVMLMPRRGSLSMEVTPGDTSSSDWGSDVVFAEIDASSTWQVYYDESAGHLVFQGGGQTVTMAQAMNAWTSYTVQVSWHAGMPLIISVNGGAKTYSGDNYTEPTWSGNLYIGSSKTGTNQGGVMIADVKGYTWYR